MRGVTPSVFKKIVEIISWLPYIQEAVTYEFSSFIIIPVLCPIPSMCSVCCIHTTDGWATITIKHQGGLGWGWGGGGATGGTGSGWRQSPYL